jgi:hypothetical protein
LFSSASKLHIIRHGTQLTIGLNQRKIFPRYNPRMNYWPELAVVLVVSALVWNYSRSQKRSQQIVDLARQPGFRLLGENLPTEIDLSASSLSNASSFWNVIAGAPHGVRIVAFGCSVGRGKGSWETTVIAVNAERASVKAGDFDMSLEKEHVDGWTLLFHKGSKMTAEELKDYIDSI